MTKQRLNGPAFVGWVMLQPGAEMKMMLPMSSLIRFKARSDKLIKHFPLRSVYWSKRDKSTNSLAGKSFIALKGIMKCKSEEFIEALAVFCLEQCSKVAGVK